MYIRSVADFPVAIIANVENEATKNDRLPT